MNIFVLDFDPVIAAQLQCDAHIRKMCVESAQMLSTAHRVIDGEQVKRLSKSGKRFSKQWSHPTLDEVLYKSVHVNHPCTKWTVENFANYTWHYEHWIALCEEFEFRYEKKHASFVKLNHILKNPPTKINKDLLITNFAIAMGSNPECIFLDDVVKSYRAFYQTKQSRFKMKWKKRNTPDWFIIHEKSK